MKFRVFIDGAEGTTGLKVHQYFSTREDIQVLPIDPAKRKDPEERLRMMKQADISFLCLPDAAAREIAQAAPSPCRIIDTSTAHRTDPEWVYGLPELREDGGGRMRDRIRSAARLANPGCHATGVITLLRPLVQQGILDPDTHLSVTSLTGYSGGGKKMIAAYEDPARGELGSSDPRRSPGQYALGQQHKHIPEILAMTGLTKAPAFLPVVADYYSGMQVIIPLPGEALRTGNGGTDPEALTELYRDYYEGEAMIGITAEDARDGFVYGSRLSGTNRLEISVHGSCENPVLIATFDNLGKGASGAALQNMNLMLGIDETKGLL